MTARTHHVPLRIAVSSGALSPQVAALLSRQRAEEPQTPVVLEEVSVCEQVCGLEDGRYDLGFALTTAPGHSLNAQPLWHDELALAVPIRSPLLNFTAVPLEEFAHYPLIRWRSDEYDPVDQLMERLQQQACTPPEIFCVRTFELMAILVAAGYGIGLGAKSRIAAARELDIIMRPLAGDRQELTTYILRPPCELPPSVDRLAERAQAISG